MQFANLNYYQTIHVMKLVQCHNNTTVILLSKQGLNNPKSLLRSDLSARASNHDLEPEKDSGCASGEEKRASAKFERTKNTWIKIHRNFSKMMIDECCEMGVPNKRLWGVHIVEIMIAIDYTNQNAMECRNRI